MLLCRGCHRVIRPGQAGSDQQAHMAFEEESAEYMFIRKIPRRAIQCSKRMKNTQRMPHIHMWANSAGRTLSMNEVEKVENRKCLAERTTHSSRAWRARHEWNFLSQSRCHIHTQSPSSSNRGRRGVLRVLRDRRTFVATRTQAHTHLYAHGPGDDGCRIVDDLGNT